MEVLLAAFVAGLLGGVHCVGMCGGIAGALGGATQRVPAIRVVPVGTSVSATRGQTLRRLIAFNAGRIGSYAVAGGVAGTLGSVVTLANPVEVGRTAAFIVAQTMLVLLGLYIAGWSAFFPRLEAAGGRIWQTIEPLRRRVLPVDSAPKAMAAGAVWGWVPCGLVYGMLPLALTGGNALNGALVLIAFGMGTLPWLLAAGTLGSRLARFRQSRAVRRVMGLLLILLAVMSVLLLLHRH